MNLNGKIVATPAPQDKTPLQMAIEEIDFAINMVDKFRNEMSLEHSLDVIKSKITALLPAERQFAMDAFNSGMNYNIWQTGL